MINYPTCPSSATIGWRIEYARKRRKLTRKEMAEQIPTPTGCKPLTAETLRKWEDGINAVSAEWILAISKYFDCDVEYLFGIIPYEKKETADIAEATGLTESAVNRLKEFKCGAHDCIGDFFFDREIMDTLSGLITSPSFYVALQALSKTPDPNINKYDLSSVVVTPLASGRGRIEYITDYENKVSAAVRRMTKCIEEVMTENLNREKEQQMHLKENKSYG